MNPLYSQMQNNAPQPGGDFMRRFQQFRQTVQGDPRQQVQNLLNSGRVSQSQYDRAVQLATQIQRMMGGK